jgi:hypothetical protein
MTCSTLHRNPGLDNLRYSNRTFQFFEYGTRYYCTGNPFHLQKIHKLFTYVALRVHKPQHNAELLKARNIRDFVCQNRKEACALDVIQNTGANMVSKYGNEFILDGLACVRCIATTLCQVFCQPQITTIAPKSKQLQEIAMVD